MKSRLKFQRLAFVCILAAILLNFPMISAFNKSVFVMGLPILYLYVLIVLLFTVALSTAIIIKKQIMNIWLMLFVTLLYLVLLFVVAYVAEKKQILSNKWSPFIYALSIGVYCTAWTFYGSIGRATISGPDFLAIYVGPILLMPICLISVHLAFARTSTSLPC